MSLNWKEVDLILDELQLTDAHIQKIKQPDFQSLLFSIYHPGAGRFNLLISLEQGANRIHKTTRQIEKKQAKLQRFAQFLRSRILGGRIVECSQPGKDRIVRMSIRQGGQYTYLMIRLWGGAANVLAVDDQNIILDALFRRPARGEVSGGSFAMPKAVQNTPEQPNQRTFDIRERIPDTSFNEQIELEYSGRHQNIEKRNLLNTAEKIYQGKLGKLQATLGNLKKKLNDSEQYENYRTTGDLLAANAYLIKPGMEWIEVTDYSSGETVKIALKQELNAGENIEHYYKQYRKSKGALENVQDEIRNVQMRISQLEDEYRELHESVNPDHDQIDNLKTFIAREKQEPRQTSQTDRLTPPGLQFRSGGFTILVGRTAAENDMLLRKYTRGNDYWLHTRDYPGGYVFIKVMKGKSIPLETLLDAGNLALHYSKGRANGKGELYYTQVKYLRRAKHGQLGLVIPTQEKNLSVVLDQKRLDKLFNN